MVRVQGEYPSFLIVTRWVPGDKRNDDRVLPIYFPSISISHKLGSDVTMTAAWSACAPAGCCVVPAGMMVGVVFAGVFSGADDLSGVAGTAVAPVAPDDVDSFGEGAGRVAEPTLLE